MEETFPFPRPDKSAFSTGQLSDPPDDREDWLSRTPEERLEAIEIMRQIIYGYNPTATRLQRVLEATHEKQVEYWLVGCNAVGYYGYPRATAEMDIWVAI